MTPHPPAASVRRSDAARPRVQFWIERDETGGAARYAAGLAHAWQGWADLDIRLEPNNGARQASIFSGLRVSDDLSLGPWDAGARRRALTNPAPDLLILVGERAGRHGVRAAQRAGIAATAYLALSKRIYDDRSLRRVIGNYVVQTRILHNVSRIVVPTCGMRYQFLMRDWVPEDRIFLLPAPVPAPSDAPPESSHRLRVALGVGPGECHVVYAGAFTSNARLDWLLRSWALVEEARVPARLTLIGSGPEEAALRDGLHQLGLESCALCKPDRPFAEYVATADIAAMTHEYAILDSLPVWAMQYAQPVVAMEADGVRMYVTHDAEGLLVPLGDTTRMADALLALIRDPTQRARMGEAGARRVAQLHAHSFQTCARELFQALWPGASSP